MQTSIATVSIGGDLQEKLAAVAAAGYDGVEIFENDFLTFDGTPAAVGRMVRDHGLQIMLFQPFRDFEGLPPAQRELAFDRARRKFDLMNELGCDLILICSNVSPDALGGIDRAADDLHALGDMAARQGIRVGYEALAWGRHINDHRDAWEVVRRADHPAVGLILDSFHTLARQIEVDSIRAIPADKIFFVQLADAPSIDMDLLYWSRHYRNMPGQGDLPVVDFVRAVAATGYNGPLSLEIFNDQFRSGSPRRIAVDGYRSLVYLVDQVRRQEADIAIDMPDMPDRIAVSGIEFIEFTAEDADVAPLSNTLFQLGFQRWGRHIAKQVEVWQQGNIKIIINTDREGFAHNALLTSGTSVCDIGLRVSNGEATIARAGALGVQLFSQPAGPGEIEIPAIRGVGGSILHFLDAQGDLQRVWDVEFVPVDEQPGAIDVGLTDIDHVAQTMDYGELLSWLLFYTSIFNTRKTAMVDVPDPSGLVRSQVIENPSGSLRLTLNGAESRQTFAGRFLAENLGSAVQHIALRTDNIFDTAQALVARGFDALEVSANYYGDLQARLNLSSSLVERLQRLNILYDRVEEGEYYQLYSNSYGEGFFFEIVQRTGGYAGYGAANAPFRIASQKRALQSAGQGGGSWSRTTAGRGNA